MPDCTVEDPPPPAVSNLRSKFEQLAAAAAAGTTPPPPPPLPTRSPLIRPSHHLPPPPHPPLPSSSSLDPISAQECFTPSTVVALPRPSSTFTTRKPPPPPPPLHSRPPPPPLPLRSSPSPSPSPFDGDLPPRRSTQTTPSPPVPRSSARSDRLIPPPPPPRPTPPSASSLDPRHDRLTSSESTFSLDHSSSHDNTESDSSPHESSPLPSLPPRPRPPKPPRPPIRTIPPPRSATAIPPSPSVTLPPPLPDRRNTHSFLLDDRQRVSASPASAISLSPDRVPSPSIHSPAPSSAPRKSFGSLPPPPTRTIAPGDKLPPPRVQHSGSSSDSEEEDPKSTIDLLPDSTRSSRRPPTLHCHNYNTSHIHVPAYNSVVALAGHVVVVAAHHHLRVYDLALSEAPLHDLDAKSLGLDSKSKDPKITCMEFKPTLRYDCRARHLWLGTKDGHILELDVHSGSVLAVKFSAHSHPVSHIIRHASSIATLDEGGKILVFMADPDGVSDVSLSTTQPRITRIAEKQDFARVLNGQLWTSSRDSSAAVSGRSARTGFAVRIHDIFSHSAVNSKSIIPAENLGAVLSGTILPSQPGRVFLGHEGGFVSLWSTTSEDNTVQCEEVIKLSASDVLCLEGVNERLWAGNRQGVIGAYDVVPRPWVVTNCWVAHSTLPVLRIAVDPFSIEKMGQLCVYSIGRDEKVHFWDGLLGVDWIDQTLIKREREFSTFRHLDILIVTFNLDSAKPDALTGSHENISFLEDCLRSVDAPDVIVFGFQELIDLESRKMAAKTVLLGAKSKNTDGGISQKVSTSYKKWYDRLVHAVRLVMSPSATYTVTHTENLVGLFTCVFVKNSERNVLKNPVITTIKRGMGGRYGNKGGIVSRFVIDDTSLCFINCHLAAGQGHVRQRNSDIAAILEGKSIFPATDSFEDPVAYVNGGDGSMILDHEIVFLNGDMNYRIDLRRDAIIANVQSGNLNHLLSQDQLLKEMSTNRGFRLRSFIEGPLTFPPTYKYDRRSNQYDSSEKRRSPAWCDRVLWRSNDPSRVEQLHYQRYEVDISDHRPVSAAFRATVKSVRPELRAQVKSEVQGDWFVHQKEHLVTAQQFYHDHHII